MTERDETYARIANAMIEQKAQENRDSGFLVPAAVRDTGRAVARLRDLYRFGSIRTAKEGTWTR